MPIPGIQEFARLLCRYIGQFLRSLLLISQPFYPVLEGLILLHLLFQYLLLLTHFGPRDD